MAKASSSKVAPPAKQVKSRESAREASESGASADEKDSLVGDEDGDDTSSADSDELEDVEPRRQNNGESSRGAGPSRPSGSSKQFPYVPFLSQEGLQRLMMSDDMPRH